MSTSWDRVRAIADAVLYEGYLLYPYRATSGQNQSRWQFGVLGPDGAAARGIGEDDTMSAQVLIDPGPDAALTVVVRCLQLQRRIAERATGGGGGYERVDQLTAGTQSWLTWDEAVECELSFGPFTEPDVQPSRTLPFVVAGGCDVEPVDGGRLVRRREELRGELTVLAEPDDGLLRISLVARNVGAPSADKDEAIAASLIGTHVILQVEDGDFVSLLEPPPSAVDAVARCRQHRCFPVLAGPPGEKDVVLVSPIILYDHPEIAEQSEGALYDSTEIDEILTLRVMTMTDEEKAQARSARHRRRSRQRRAGHPRQPGGAASVAPCRCAGHLLRRHGRAGDLGARGRRRPAARRRRPRRGPGRGSARVVRPLSVLRTGRSRTNESKESDMAAVGYVATVIVGLVVIGGVVVGLRSLPDARRYLKMRRM
jgi:hypothetical protein